MTAKPFLGAILGASLIGCAVVETGDHVWFKEGGTQAEQDAALATARVQAAQAHVTPPEERDIVIRSMTAQGWRLKPKAAAPPLKSETTRKTPAPMKPGMAIP
ncbi:MAG: hypothetical protein ABIZ56_03715 [Chthoniobacteraceae bacterium]